MISTSFKAAVLGKKTKQKKQQLCRLAEQVFFLFCVLLSYKDREKESLFIFTSVKKKMLNYLILNTYIFLLSAHDVKQM